MGQKCKIAKKFTFLCDKYKRRSVWKRGQVFPLSRVLPFSPKCGFGEISPEKIFKIYIQFGAV